MSAETEKIDKIFWAAITTFGDESQMNVAQEELAELIAAISRVRRNRPDAIENLTEEIADTLVVVRQLMLMFGVQEGVSKVFSEKVARLQERIRNGRDW